MTDNYQQYTAADWRKVLRDNQRKTIFVMLAFVWVYLLIGLMLDLYVNISQAPNVPFSDIFMLTIQGKMFPVFTVIATVIAIIALIVSLSFHNRIMLLGTEAKEISENVDLSREERQILNIVQELQIAAGMRYCPKVYIIEADYMNAFASGYSEKSAMVAITRGLMQKLKRDELQAVMAHELSHIRHGDIKLTLVASVLANLMLIIMDLVFYSVLFGGNNSGSDSNSDRSVNVFFIVVLVLRYVLPFVTMFLLLFLSRKREYMADAGSVELTRDSSAMARALLKIQADYKQNAQDRKVSQKQTAHENVRLQAYIFDPVTAGFTKSGMHSELFSTHPSIKNRLKALGYRDLNGEQ